METALAGPTDHVSALHTTLEHHDAEQLAALVESSISVRKNSIDSRTKFLKLGLDNESISSKVHSLYVD